MRLIAHRGASGLAPENTMAAFALAVDMGAKAFELDVHRSKDGELAVIHDDDFKRVAGRRDQVRDLAWAEIARIDVGSWFDKKFSGERVPSLGEVLKLSSGRQTVHVELKAGSDVYPGIEVAVLGLIGRLKAWEWTVISSFDHKALRRTRELEPRARLGYLRGLTSPPLALKETSELSAESLHISLRQVNAAQVRAARAQGLKVFVYTVNDAQDVPRLERLGIDSIFSNYPHLLRPFSEHRR